MLAQSRMKPTVGPRGRSGAKRAMPTTHTSSRRTRGIRRSVHGPPPARALRTVVVSDRASWNTHSWESISNSLRPCAPWSDGAAPLLSTNCTRSVREARICTILAISGVSPDLVPGGLVVCALTITVVRACADLHTTNQCPGGRPNVPDFGQIPATGPFRYSPPEGTSGHARAISSATTQCIRRRMSRRRALG